MSANYTITLSLGSGSKGELLALKIKAWAGKRPISEAIRDLILREIEREYTGKQTRDMGR